MALWGGRFSGDPAEDMVRFSQSIDVDLRMAREDIAGSRAHARMLAEAGLLDGEELARILQGLDEVEEEILSGAWVPGAELEDIHMAVEHRLIERIGPVAGKLHTARSRNDQVATDLRLWLRARLRELAGDLEGLVEVLLDRVDADGRTLMPGYTHLQRGQPIWLGHHLLAHAWALTRDLERIDGALDRVDRSPLGACAMAGTPHPIDRERTAELLGFRGLIENAMDAVSARDHVLETASACAILCATLSRMAAELVLWSSREFDFVRLGEGYATGSSIMPQKRNPDAAELVRGRAARIQGVLAGLLALVKGLPMSYNRDLQEEREPLMDAVEGTAACVRILQGVWRTLTVRKDRFERELQGDFALATELADHLAARGVPFREAHHAAGRAVRLCEERGTDLAGLTLDDLRAIHPAFDASALAALDPVRAAERRVSRGGTAWSEVRRQVGLLRELLRHRRTPAREE